MFTEDEQRFIDKVYKGNVEACIKAHKQGKKQALKWNDILANAKTFPELALNAQSLIKTLLGFQPPDYHTLPHEAFLRALLNDYRNGQYSFDEFLLQAEEHIKLIRNDELAGNNTLSYSRDIYHDYFGYLTQYSDQVRERLTRFLGYEPQLEHSVFAEILLRQAFGSDQFHFPETLTTTDMQAITIIKYREVLFEQGRDAADRSPLVAMDILARNSGKQTVKWDSLT